VRKKAAARDLREERRRSFSGGERLHFGKTIQKNTREEGMKAHLDKGLLAGGKKGRLETLPAEKRERFSLSGQKQTSKGRGRIVGPRKRAKGGVSLLQKKGWLRTESLFG